MTNAFVILLFAFLYVGGYLVITKARKLNDEMLQKIKTCGLYHITTRGRAMQIMGNDGIANLKASNALAGLTTTMGKRAVFFFAGKPGKLAIDYNIKSSVKRDMVMIYIPPEYITDAMLRRIKWRLIDKAVMHLGDCKAHAQIIEL